MWLLTSTPRQLSVLSPVLSLAPANTLHLPPSVVGMPQKYPDPPSKFTEGRMQEGLVSYPVKCPISQMPLKGESGGA
jgi:hypothetical protein